MNAGFFQTRRARRKIVQILQTQQQADATAASLLKTQFLGDYRKLLNCIGEFLDGYCLEFHFEDGVFTTRKVDKKAAALFKSVAGTVSLQEWSTLRASEANILLKKLTTEKLLTKAEKEYDEVAPFGFLSKVGSSEVEKSKIDKRKSAKNALKAKLQKIEAELDSVIAKQQETAKAFLRNATSPESLKILAESSPIQEEVSQILRDSAKTLASTWSAVSEAQLEALTELEEHLGVLRSTYTENFSTKTTLLLG
jgi:hypothetical protein